MAHLNDAKLCVTAELRKYYLHHKADPQLLYVMDQHEVETELQFKIVSAGLSSLRRFKGLGAAGDEQGAKAIEKTLTTHLWC